MVAIIRMFLLRLNPAGIMPPIIASALLYMPLTFMNFVGGASEIEWINTVIVMLGRGQPLFIAIYALMIVAFSFFFVPIAFNIKDTAQNLQRSGAFIPGIRPGKSTERYLDAVLNRLTTVGAHIFDNSLSTAGNINFTV